MIVHGWIIKRWLVLVKEIAHGYEYLDPKNMFAS